MPAPYRPPEPAVDAASIAPPGPPRPAGTADGRRTLGRLPTNVGRGLIGVFDPDNLVPLLVGAAASGSSAFLDDSVREHASNPDSGFGKALETAGGWPSSIVVAGLFTAGRHGKPLPSTGPRTTWSVSPVVGRRARGVRVSLSF